MSVTIAVYNASGALVNAANGENEACLSLAGAWSEGDYALIGGGKHLQVKIDRLVPDGEVYAPKGEFKWTLPIGENRLAYSPEAFKTTDIHARAMTEAEIKKSRVISLNPCDLRGDTDFYPHATANVETRNESCFAARCVIDGFTDNAGHGEWPYQSWGIGTRTDAELTLNFGRAIRAQGVGLVLRADWPHDSRWQSADITLSDGFKQTLNLVKTAEEQIFMFKEEHDAKYVILNGLIKAADESPFPALTQLKVYGHDK